MRGPDFLTEAENRKISEGQRPVTLNFIDFRKAFDSVHRPELWKVLKQYGISREIISVI